MAKKKKKKKKNPVAQWKWKTKKPTISRPTLETPRVLFFVRPCQPLLPRLSLTRAHVCLDPFFSHPVRPAFLGLESFYLSLSSGEKGRERKREGDRDRSWPSLIETANNRGWGGKKKNNEDRGSGLGRDPRTNQSVTRADS